MPRRAAADTTAIASTEKERAALYRRQREKLELELAERRGRLLDREEIGQAVMATLARVRARLLAIPKRAAPQVLGLESLPEVVNALEESIHEALAELSATKIIAPADHSRERGDTDGGSGVVAGDDAAAAPDGERVGRPRKKAQPRGKRRARKVED